MTTDTQRIYEQYLVAAARTGDVEALGRLAGCFQSRLLAHAWRLTNDRELAREVTQEAWFDILRGLARLSDTAAFPAWAFRIVTRRCAAAIRRLQRERQVRGDSDEDLASDVNPAREIELSADAAKAKAALAELPPEQRAALALYYLEDLSVAEIAHALDVPAGTVKTRLLHGRRKLRTQLGGDEHA